MWTTLIKEFKHHSSITANATPTNICQPPIWIVLWVIQYSSFNAVLSRWQLIYSHLNDVSLAVKFQTNFPLLKFMQGLKWTKNTCWLTNETSMWTVQYRLMSMPFLYFPHLQWCWELNPRPYPCWVGALPLSHMPIRSDIWEVARCGRRGLSRWILMNSKPACS